MRSVNLNRYPDADYTPNDIGIREKNMAVPMTEKEEDEYWENVIKSGCNIF